MKDKEGKIIDTQENIQKVVACSVNSIEREITPLLKEWYIQSAVGEPKAGAGTGGGAYSSTTFKEGLIVFILIRKEYMNAANIDMGLK